MLGGKGEQRGVNGRKVMGRRVKGNGYPPPYLNVFKIKKGEGEGRGKHSLLFC